LSTSISARITTVVLGAVALAFSPLQTFTQALGAGVGRTLSTQETHLVVGGTDTVYGGYDCNPVSLCSNANVADTCAQQAEGTCTGSLERVAIVGAVGKNCGLVKGTRNCTETTPNVDCAKNYVCQWNMMTSLCNRTSSVYSVEKAPENCKSEEAPIAP
jgi:hypothetical protein